MVASQIITGPITKRQRAALFAAASRRGLSIDELRALTPEGSIRKLTAAQASDLLDRLNAGGEFDRRTRRRPRAPRRPKGVIALVSDAQRRKIEALRIELGWTADQLAGWLAKRHYVHGGTMDRMVTTRDGQEVIELLKAVRDRQAKSRSRSGAQDTTTSGPEARGHSGGPTTRL